MCSEINAASVTSLCKGLKMVASSLKGDGEVAMARRCENREDAVRAAGEGSFGRLVRDETKRKERKSAIISFYARRGLDGVDANRYHLVERPSEFGTSERRVTNRAEHVGALHPKSTRS